MGMSASQARFLGLTARKTNVEYEGQQVNQQRTVLGNETANYYNDLLGMSVPVPPSPNDYTKTVYTFNDGALTNSITSMTAQPNGMYLISYTSSWTNDFSLVAARTNRVTNTLLSSDLKGKTLYNEFTKGTAGGCYTHALEKTGNQLQHIAHVLYHMLPEGTYYATDGTEVVVADTNNSDTGKYWTTPTASGMGGDRAIMDSIANMLGGKPIQQKLVDLLSDTIKAWKDRSLTTGEKTAKSDEYKAKLKEIVEIDLREALDDGYLVGASKLRELGIIGSQDYIDNDEYLKTLSPLQLNNLKDEENEYIDMLNKKYGNDSWFVRYIQNTTSGDWEPFFYKYTDLVNAIYDENASSLTNINCYTIGSAKETEEFKGIKARFEQDATGRIINITLHPDEDDQVTYAVTTNTVTDQAKYDDAMNQYEYDKALYDKTIQETNAKIKIIQNEDKNLELRLKQLDTEQEAIQTEMDAVQKVIEKNTESTFKTFG